MTKTRNDLLADLAEIVADYREGEIVPRTPGVIDQWLKQFPSESQLPILDALVHVFGKTYISKEHFKGFLAALATSNKLSPAASPSQYWRQVRFLNIQRGGNSQKEILAMFNDVLYDAHGFGLAQCDGTNGDFIYLDDCVGTGNRVRTDVCSWIETTAPARVTLHIITPVLYAGSWWIEGKIRETAAAKGKTVTLHNWRLDQFQMENRRAKRDMADVLWPTSIPNDPDVRSYSSHLEANGHPFEPRAPGNPGASAIFADDAQKVLLEEAMLRRGCQIRRECVNLPERARPLGYHNLDNFGFGSMFVTFRNCPNNCPLALWVQQAEYPALFPRKTNTQAKIEQLMKELFG